MLGTPAARATPTVMKALASSGNRPAGRYAPTLLTGTYFAAHDPGDDLVLEVVQVVALHGREPVRPLGPGVERGLEVGGQRRGQLLDLFRAISKSLPPVQPSSRSAYERRLPARLDVGQHGGDGRDHRRVGLRRHVGAIRLADDGVGTGDPGSVGGGQVQTDDPMEARVIWQGAAPGDPHDDIGTSGGDPGDLAPCLCSSDGVILEETSPSADGAAGFATGRCAMGKALVVYESMWGNTEKGGAVADGLGVVAGRGGLRGRGGSGGSHFGC